MIKVPQWSDQLASWKGTFDMPFGIHGHGRRNYKAWEYEVISREDKSVVKIADLKAFMKISSKREDSVVQDSLSAAVFWFEKYTGLTLAETKFRTFRDDFGNVKELRRTPFVSLEKIEFLVNDVFVAFDLTKTVLDRRQPFTQIRLKQDQQWPFDIDRQVSAVKIEFTAGFGNHCKIPPDIQLALKQLALFFFENRGDCSAETIPDMIKDVADQNRIRTAFISGS